MRLRANDINIFACLITSQDFCMILNHHLMHDCFACARVLRATIRMSIIASHALTPQLSGVATCSQAQ